MKNICFIANYTKTYFFDALADNLMGKGITIYWIAVNKENYNFLKSKYSKDQILYLPKESFLSASNNPVGEFKLNELIYGDRVLKYNYAEGLKYLTSIQKPIYEFLKSNSVSTIFGEVTWAHEILIHRMASNLNELKAQYLDMHTVRIPSGRFTFFTTEFQDDFLITEPNYAQFSLPEAAFELKKPDYLAINDALVKESVSLKGRLKRLKYFITGENLDPNDITLLPSKSKYRTLLPIKNELNKESYKKVKTVDYEFLKDKKFILTTLHKQPEASIDVLGRYVEDQTRNIMDLWRVLPQGWFLVVKEHSNAVGDRSYNWFRNLSKYQNIIFAHEKLDSYILIDMCQAVYTISGTVAYEAALKHKPALVMTDVFFSLPYIKKVTNETFRKCKNLEELLDQIPNLSIDEDLVKKNIFYNSYPGTIGDPLNNPACMEEDNLQNVSAAILNMLKIV